MKALKCNPLALLLTSKPQILVLAQVSSSMFWASVDIIICLGYRLLFTQPAWLHSVSLSQLLLAKCVWKEHRSDSGRAYFYNSENKESRWTIPKELEELKEEIKKEEEEGYVVDSATVCMRCLVLHQQNFLTCNNICFLVCLQIKFQQLEKCTCTYINVCRPVAVLVSG